MIWLTTMCSGILYWNCRQGNWRIVACYSLAAFLHCHVGLPPNTGVPVHCLDWWQYLWKPFPLGSGPGKICYMAEKNTFTVKLLNKWIISLCQIYGRNSLCIILVTCTRKGQYMGTRKASNLLCPLTVNVSVKWHPFAISRLYLKKEIYCSFRKCGLAGNMRMRRSFPP